MIWMYGPGGAAGIFESEEDAPAGWADHPAKVKAAKSAPEPEAASEVAKFDHDGDGKVGGSKPRRKPSKARGAKK